MRKTLVMTSVTLPKAEDDEEKGNEDEGEARGGRNELAELRRPPSLIKRIKLVVPNFAASDRISSRFNDNPFIVLTI